MWQLSEAIDGMAEACKALDVPVVGGNVSLYNESSQGDIDPTPVVAMLGLVDDLQGPPPPVGLIDGGVILLLGTTTRPSLGASLWAARLRSHRNGTLVGIDYAMHRRLVEMVAELVADGELAGIHDVSDGGVGLALAEMAVKSGVGVDISGIADHVELFGEAPSRVLVCVEKEWVEAVVARAASAGVEVTTLGRAHGRRIRIGDLVDLDLGEAVESWRVALPRALGLV
jgi:phosphoribosylformylglycinamidine synthase